MHFLHDKKLIAIRIQEKRTLILEWLKGEGYSTTSILCRVLGLKDRATRLTLGRMAADGLVSLHEVEGLGGAVKIWGITAHGAAMAADITNPDFTYFEPGRLSQSTIQHSLAVQEARLHLVEHGWRNWITDRQCHQLHARDGWLKIPDALATDPEGKYVAIEVERTFKTIKRYQSIISSYLQMVAARKIERIDYICPIQGMAPRLEALFQSIRTVPVKGQTAAITKEHLSNFRFIDFSTGKESKHGYSI
ncbi:MobC family replication-relaxation protein [Methylovorus mays]|uniref:MobC family replication-relaxation protein n=1 Tax=Methylovorus mays TaxID=184077 RepID=UPI001E5CEF5B|nr:MobC family replication-relaxation protein [Methylovorus mays]MCB5207799.1 replication-relaxation family protein [Methylovorus mays]